MGLTVTEAADKAAELRAARAADEMALAQSDTVQARLARHGMSESAIFTKIKSLLNAYETKHFTNHGMVTDQRSVPAHDIRLRTAVTVLKMMGLLSDRNTVVNVGNAMVAFAESGPPAWQPSSVRQQLTDTAPTPTVHSDSDSVPSHLSTLVGPLGRPGGLGHNRQNNRWKAKCSPNGKVAKGVRKMQSHSAKQRCKPTFGKNKGKVKFVPVKRRKRK